jgi:hypothetical protein
MEIVQKLLEKYVKEWNTMSTNATVPYSQVITDIDQVLQLLQSRVSKSVCECVNSKPMSRSMGDKRYYAVCRKIVEETVY